MAWLRKRKSQKERAQARKAVRPGPRLVGASNQGAQNHQPSESDANSTTALTEPAIQAGPGTWKMGLIVTASALCGGIAVVLWNRRLLTRMREEVPGPSEQQGRLWEDDF